METRRRSKYARSGNKRAQFFCERFCFFERAIYEHKTFAILQGALPGNRLTCSAARAEDHYSQIAHIHRELTANGAQESPAVCIRANQFLIANPNCVYRAAAMREFIGFVDLPEGRDLVRHSQINSDKIELAEGEKRRSQFVSANVKARVLHVDFARAQGGVLHSRRK